MSILNLSEEVKVEAAQAKLENGTVLEAEAFEAGNEVFIVSEDERVAVPVGEYVMEDGRTLVVAEEGIIASIGEASEEEEAPAAEEAPAEEVEAAEEEQMNYVTREELAEVVNEIKSMVEEMMGEREEKMAAEKAEKLKGIIYDEIQKLKKDGPSAVDLDKARKHFQKSREENLRKNPFWLKALEHNYIYNENVVAPENYDQIVKDLDQKAIQKMAKKLLKDGQHVEIIMKPKKL